MQDRRTKSAAARASKPRKGPAAPVALRTLDEITTYLESEAAAARATDNPQRANAASRVAKEARDLLRVGELEAENKELRALLVEKHP